MLKFIDSDDYCDFAFFLDLLDPNNQYSSFDVEIAYHKYDTLRINCPSDCEDFRAYVKSCINK